ncbi:MAG: glycoside hydrolase family 88 protein [Clostridia bacterium]|nr:glycoside hydrolase family 88 protein [Clostridia bacterium]
MRELIKKTAQSMLSIEKSKFQEKCPISIVDINKWEWAQGVGLYGLYRYYEVSGDEKYLDILKNWFKDRINEGLPEKCVNTCAPLLTLSFVYDGDEEYKALMKEWALWLMNDLERAPENGFVHSGSGVVCHNQLWDDTLFMCVLFLARAGIIFGEDDWLEETKRQFLVHLRYLTDLKTGLMFHGWSFEDRSNFAEAKWGRGNAWVTVCIPDYIDIMGDKLEKGMKDYLIGCLDSQIRALEKYQTSSGMWRTLIDDETTYEEASATAGFGYGIHKAVRLGYVDKRFEACAIKALEGIKGCIDENGVVDKVSYGTGLSYDVNYYKNIQILPMTYGQALAILFLSESMN